jgi:hypothetical protein
MPPVSDVRKLHGVWAIRWVVLKRSNRIGGLS